jgi:hypothetical protein
MMAGYRDNSGFDPYASPRYGRPLRPYNWVQWTGIALAIGGIAFELAYFAAKLGWIRNFADSPMIGSTLVLLSIPLVNSRREELPDPAPELAAQRKRWLIIVTLVCVVVFGAAIAIHSLTGA